MQPLTPVSERKDYTTESLKIPPHSVEAEQSVLGGLMLENSAWDQVADRLVEVDFYQGDHRLIFRAINSLAARGSPFDVVTLKDWLVKHNLLEDAGGLAYLAMLARDTPSAANIAAYADIVRERSVLRQLGRVGTEIAGSVYNTQGRGSHELLDEAEKKVFAIAEQGMRHRQGFVAIGKLLPKTLDRIDTLYQRNNPITGVPTGWTDFDEMTAGLQAGDLIIVAGRPSMGKTAFAMNIAEHVALRQQQPVAVFSMEMPGEQLAMRLLSSLGRIDHDRIRTGKLLDEDWPRLTSSMALLSDKKLFVDDSASLSPTEVRARARRLYREHGGLGLILVDYLQLMRVPGSTENRATEISEISRNLKALARELSVPVVALSQLNRSLEQRTDKRPVMSDLRESGAIEQDADLICFIYRDEVYNSDSPEKGKAEIIIAKQRNGPIGKVYMTFLGRYTRFESFTPDTYAITHKPSPLPSGGEG
ncbi:MAG: replicative DNA helicase [Pseudomonadota bacterium]|nr:replicative DNA helicase [Pseudomonadota bacterium]